MLTIGDFNSFWVFLGHPVQHRVSKKKLMPFQIQISREFHYGTLSIPMVYREQIVTKYTQYRMSKKTDTIEIQTSSIAFLQFDRR